MTLLPPGFPALSALVLLPWAVALVAPLARRAATAFGVGVGLAIAEVALAAATLLTFDPERDGFQQVEQAILSPLLRWHLGLDGLSAPFLALVALLGLLVVLYAQPAEEESPGLFVSAIAVLQGALFGLFLACDALLFCAFLVVMVSGVAFLTGRWGTSAARGATTVTYLQFMGLAVILLLVGFGLAAAAQLPQMGAWRFDLPSLLSQPVASDVQTPIFVCLLYGFGILAPIFPFHGWLPRVAQHGTVVVGAVMLLGAKVGIYGMLRFLMPLCPDAAARWADDVVLLGSVGLLYGGALAIVQINLRRLLAFSAVSHGGALLIGLFSLNAPGLMGTLFLALSLGVATSGLAFVTGFLYRRTHTTQIPRLGGLFNAAPLLALTFLVVALTGIAMPGTASFDAGHLVLEGSAEAHGWPYALVAAAGNVLAAAYLLWAYQRIFLAERRGPAWHDLHDLSLRELALAGTLVAVIFGVGLYSKPWIHLVERAIAGLALPEAR